MTMQDDSLRPEELAEAAAAAIEDAQGRSVREAAKVLADAGLIGVGATEDDGGLGLGLNFAVPIAQAGGKGQVGVPLVESLVLAKALAGSPEAAALVAGEKLATIAWQGDLTQGMAGHARQLADCDWVLVADGQGGAALIEVQGQEIETDPALDPERPQAWIHLKGARTVATLDAEAFAALIHEAQVLTAAWLNGAAQGALERTASYMATRVQFGRPLSAKQAVRHWLSRMRLQWEAASASVHRVLSPDEFGAPRSPLTALSVSIDSAAFVLEKSIHLHGGMGFTWELPLHVALRDVRKIDAAFGSGKLTQDIGRQFIQAA